MKRERVWLVAAVGLLLALGVLAALTPGEPAGFDTRDIQVVLPAGGTPMPVYLEQFAQDYAVTPPLRPTTDPLYTPGANRRYPFGAAFSPNLDQFWSSAPTGCQADGSDCASTGFNWARYLTPIAAQRAYTVTFSDGVTTIAPVWVHLPPIYHDNDSSCGTSGDPCTTLYWPTWPGASSFKFTYQNVLTPTPGATPWYYDGIRYDDPKLLNYWKQMIDEAAVQLGDKIQGVILGPGYQREIQQVKAASGDPNGANVVKAVELTVTCTEYKNFVRALTEYAYDVFSPLGIDVQIAAGPSPCASGTARGYRKDLQTNATTGWLVAAPTREIGFSNNANRPDLAGGGAEVGWSAWDYNWYTTGQTNNDLGLSMSYESGDNPVVYASPNQETPVPYGTPAPDGVGLDQYAHLYWSHLVTTGSGATHLRDNGYWYKYQNALTWDVIDKKLGDRPQYLSYIFRRSEYPIYNLSGQTIYGSSGIDGGFGYWLSMPDYRQYETACSPKMVTAVATRNVAAKNQGTVYWLPCRALSSQNPLATPTYVALPSPVATAKPRATPIDMPDLYRRSFDRQAQVLSSSGATGEYDLVLDANHPWYNQTKNVTVRVRYLDIGTDTFTVKLPGDTHTVTKGGTGNWVQTAYTINNVLLANTQTTSARTGSYFAIIANEDGSEYIHELALDLAATASTPVATATPTYTPTVTPTPIPTATPTATATPNYTTRVRFNEISPNEAIDWNLSGDVSPSDRFFELINWQPTEVDIAGWTVSNGNVSYTLPEGVKILPYEHKVFLAEDVFHIPASGTLTLREGATVRSSVTYGAQGAGLCYAAKPDGSATWNGGVVCTPGRAN